MIQRSIILSDDGILRTATRAFDKLVTLELQLVVLRDVAIQLGVGHSDIQRHELVALARAIQLREHVGDELELLLDLNRSIFFLKGASTIATNLGIKVDGLTASRETYHILLDEPQLST